MTARVNSFLEACNLCQKERVEGKMRVFVMGHRPQIRLALRRLLAQEPELGVVGETGEAKEINHGK